MALPDNRTPYKLRIFCDGRNCDGETSNFDIGERSFSRRRSAGPGSVGGGVGIEIADDVPRAHLPTQHKQHHHHHHYHHVQKHQLSAVMSTSQEKRRVTFGATPSRFELADQRDDSASSALAAPQSEAARQDDVSARLLSSSANVTRKSTRRAGAIPETSSTPKGLTRQHSLENLDYASPFKELSISQEDLMSRKFQRSFDQHLGPALNRLDNPKRTDYTYSKSTSYRSRTPSPSWEFPRLQRRMLTGSPIKFVPSIFSRPAALRSAEETEWFITRIFRKITRIWDIENKRSSARTPGPQEPAASEKRASAFLRPMRANARTSLSFTAPILDSFDGRIPDRIVAVDKLAAHTPEMRTDFRRSVASTSDESASASKLASYALSVRQQNLRSARQPSIFTSSSARVGSGLSEFGGLVRRGGTQAYRYAVTTCGFAYSFLISILCAALYLLLLPFKGAYHGAIYSQRKSQQFSTWLRQFILLSLAHCHSFLRSLYQRCCILLSFATTGASLNEPAASRDREVDAPLLSDGSSGTARHRQGKAKANFDLPAPASKSTATKATTSPSSRLMQIAGCLISLPISLVSTLCQSLRGYANRLAALVWLVISGIFSFSWIPKRTTKASLQQSSYAIPTVSGSPGRSTRASRLNAAPLQANHVGAAAMPAETTGSGWIALTISRVVSIFTSTTNTACGAISQVIAACLSGLLSLFGFVKWVLLSLCYITVGLCAWPCSKVISVYQRLKNSVSSSTEQQEGRSLAAAADKVAVSAIPPAGPGLISKAFSGACTGCGAVRDAAVGVVCHLTTPVWSILLWLVRTLKSLLFGLVYALIAAIQWPYNKLTSGLAYLRACCQSLWAQEKGIKRPDTNARVSQLKKSAAAVAKRNLPESSLFARLVATLKSAVTSVKDGTLSCIYQIYRFFVACLQYSFACLTSLILLVGSVLAWAVSLPINAVKKCCVAAKQAVQSFGNLMSGVKHSAGVTRVKTSAATAAKPSVPGATLFGQIVVTTTSGLSAVKSGIVGFISQIFRFVVACLQCVLGWIKSSALFVGAVLTWAIIWPFNAAKCACQSFGNLISGVKRPARVPHAKTPAAAVAKPNVPRYSRTAQVGATVKSAAVSVKKGTFSCIFQAFRFFVACLLRGMDWLKSSILLIGAFITRAVIWPFKAAGKCCVAVLQACQAFGSLLSVRSHNLLTSAIAKTCSASAAIQNAIAFSASRVIALPAFALRLVYAAATSLILGVSYVFASASVFLYSLAYAGYLKVKHCCQSLIGLPWGKESDTSAKRKSQGSKRRVSFDLNGHGPTHAFNGHAGPPNGADTAFSSDEEDESGPGDLDRSQRSFLSYPGRFVEFITAHSPFRPSVSPMAGVSPASTSSGFRGRAVAASPHGAENNAARATRTAGRRSAREPDEIESEEDGSGGACCGLPCAWWCLPLLLLLLLLPTALYYASNSPSTQQNLVLVRDTLVPIPFLLYNKTRDSAYSAFAHGCSAIGALRDYWWYFVTPPAPPYAYPSPPSHPPTNDSAKPSGQQTPPPPPPPGGPSNEELRAMILNLQSEIALLRTTCCKQPDLSGFLRKSDLAAILAGSQVDLTPLTSRLDNLERAMADIDVKFASSPDFAALKSVELPALKLQLSTLAASLKALEADVLKAAGTEAQANLGAAQNLLRAEILASIAKEIDGVRREVAEVTRPMEVPSTPPTPPPTPSRDIEFDGKINALIGQIGEISGKIEGLEGRLIGIAGAVEGAKKETTAIDERVDGILIGLTKERIRLDAELQKLRDAAAGQTASIQDLQATIAALQRSDVELRGAISGCEKCSDAVLSRLREEGYGKFTGDGASWTPEQIRGAIAAAIAQYDADKTGIADHALEPAGGTVLSIRCTETYAARSRQESIWGIPLWFKDYSPRTVIQPGVVPGECWSFKGEGHLVVQLSGVVQISKFSYEHIPVDLSPDGHIESAPKQFDVYGLMEEYDPKPILLGSYVYDRTGPPLQTFIVQNLEAPAVPIIEIHVRNNHGHPNYTCLYRFRVHGKRIYPAYGKEKNE